MPKDVKSCFWFRSLAIIVEVLVVDAGLRMIKWTALPSPRASTGMRNGRKRSNTHFVIWSGPFTGWLATPHFNLYHRRHHWPSPLDNNKAAPLPHTRTRSLWKQPLPIQQRQPRLITSSCVFMQPWHLILSFAQAGRLWQVYTYIYVCLGQLSQCWPCYHKVSKKLQKGHIHVLLLIANYCLEEKRRGFLKQCARSSSSIGTSSLCSLYIWRTRGRDWDLFCTKSTSELLFKTVGVLN